MVKLVPAKCPSCGADIEVNKNLEKTICQFCGTTVLVDDAIAKIKVEVSGKVKVSDVKDYSDKLVIAKKHIKAGKYYNAKEVLETILEDDEYNIEALKEYITLLLDYKLEFGEYLGDEFGYIALIEDKTHMIESTDDDKEHKEFIKDAKEQIKELKTELYNKKHNNLIERLYKECDTYINLSASKKDKRTKELQEHFKTDNISFDTLRDSVKEKELDEIDYVVNLILNYNKKRSNKNDTIDSIQMILSVILGIIISAIGLISEWSYIINDIKNSFEHFTITTPIAAIIFIFVGIIGSIIVVAISFGIGYIIASLISLIIKQTTK